MPVDLASAATEISFGIPSAAGAFLLGSGLSRQQVEDLSVTMIIGTFRNVRNDYATSQRELKR